MAKNNKRTSSVSVASASKNVEFYPDYTYIKKRIVFYALILILFIAFRPDGLMNYLECKYTQFEHWIEV